ncbi:hypothetical protein PROFUN_13659 [Planoprotostelium fungivorum]|uniref:F-box domain-containing protein n=1 Tax=Planoprotostelium fungivorum TaxID=1890364 RepID=A0A2P6N3G8_9EUKA|nr:hypothetical protein PROFUN_13659 [Planoprotostelium fungivorum]
MQPLPSDLWTEVFSFLPTSDLCVPCFTSKTLRDVAHKIINSRDPNYHHWWRHKKQLPTHDRDLIKWWMVNIREPVWEEARAAALQDDVSTLDLLGWDDSQLSPRHRNLCELNWRREMVLMEALVKGNKRTINACHQKEDISRVSTVECLLWLNVWPRLGEEGNLEVIQWLHNEQSIEGLPSVTWPNIISWSASGCLRPAAKAGHKHVISWFKERGDIGEFTIHDVRYKGAAEGDRMDILMWLDNDMHLDVSLDENATLADFVQSFAVLEWAMKRNVPDDSRRCVYEEAVSTGCIEYCVMNQFSLPTRGPLSNIDSHEENYEAIQLAVVHGYITDVSRISFKSTGRQFELIRWMHERDDSYHSAIQNDDLDILQWAAEEGYLTEAYHNIHQHGSIETIEWLMKTFGEKEGETYRSIASCGTQWLTLGKEKVTKWNIEPMEWMLQRKWNKSQDEVQRWFQREDITTEWLMHLWEHGRDM